MCQTKSIQIPTVSTQVANQISAMLLKDAIIGTSLLKDLLENIDMNSTNIRDSPFVKQVADIFLKAVQTAADDLPYIDTLSPKAQNERIFTIFYLLSRLHLFESISPLPLNVVSSLADSLINASINVKPFASLVRDSKLEFAVLCGELQKGSLEVSEQSGLLCETIGQTLLTKGWSDFEEKSEKFSSNLKLFASLAKKKEVIDVDEQLLWLYLASLTERKSYVALFFSCCKECLSLDELQLLEQLLNFKPFSLSKETWFLMLSGHCHSLTQMLKLRDFCFPNQQALRDLGTHSNIASSKVRLLLSFLHKIDLIMKKQDNLDEMSKEKLEMQLSKSIPVPLLKASDLAVIEYYLDIAELPAEHLIQLVVDLSSPKRQQRNSKTVRFDVPSHEGPTSQVSEEPIKDDMVLLQIFTYYSFCALKNFTDAVYGCSVHLASYFNNQAKYSTLKKTDNFDDDDALPLYSVGFSEEVAALYANHCIRLIDYGRAFLRMVYPIGLRLEVIENAFSLLFISYDHVHERIQDVAAEEAEGDMDFENKTGEPRLSTKAASVATSSSVFTTSTVRPSVPSNKQNEQVVGCLANEFLFRDMLFQLNEATKDLCNDIHMLDMEGVNFPLPAGHKVSLKTADDLGLSNLLGRDSPQSSNFKDRLYLLQRSISEGLWRMSIVSGVVPHYGALEIVISQHEFYKREFKAALISEWDRQRHSSVNSSKSTRSSKSRTKSEVTLTSLTMASSTEGPTRMKMIRNGFVERLASSTYMLALCWSANRRDLERCEQILASYPSRFGEKSEFVNEVKFQRHLNAFISYVLLPGPTTEGKLANRLKLALPFESPSRQRLSKASSNLSLASVQSETRSSPLNQLVANTLTQFDIKEKLDKLYDSQDFQNFTEFYQKNSSVFTQSVQQHTKVSIIEAALARESFASITSVDLAFCHSANLEIAAALLSNLPANGLSALQMLLTNYMRNINIQSEVNINELLTNASKWFTSSKLIQPEWTPSGVLVSPLFNASPDLVAKTRSGIMSLSRLIEMTTQALESSDHDKAEAMLTQVVHLLSADWVNVASKTIFLHSSKQIAKGNQPKPQYLSAFWNRLKEMYRSLGDLGLLTTRSNNKRDLNGPLDLLAFSSEAIFSQIVFSQPSLQEQPTIDIEEFATKLGVDLLSTIASCSCAQLPPEAHDSSLAQFDELFITAVHELLASSKEDPIEELVRKIFNYFHKEEATLPSSNIVAQLWFGCSDTTGRSKFQQARPPTYALTFQTAKIVYDRDERLFVLLSFMSDFEHLLDTEGNEEKTRPEVLAVQTQLRSLKARITVHFRPLLTYMSTSTIPLLSTLDPTFPSSLDAILLLQSTVKATLLASDMSSWFISSVLRFLISKSGDKNPVNALNFFEFLPDPVNSLPSVTAFRDMTIVYAIEYFFSPKSNKSDESAFELDLNIIVQMMARISDPSLRLEMMRRHCMKLTLSGFDFLVLTCPIPKFSDSESLVGSQETVFRTQKTETFEREGSDRIFDAKELVEWLGDWQKRIDLWMRLASLMRLDITTTTVERIQFLIVNESTNVADCLINAGDFSTGLQLLNVCGSSTFPVSLAVQLLSAYLNSHAEETITLPEQQARVAQQLEVLSNKDPDSCKELLINFLGAVVKSATSASCIAVRPARVFELLDFCKTPKIRTLLGGSGKEHALLVDKLDLMVSISNMLPQDLKESCGTLIHEPLLLIESLIMNVKVDVAVAVHNVVSKSPLATGEFETSIQNLVSVYAFKALELPTLTSNLENSNSLSQNSLYNSPVRTKTPTTTASLPTGTSPSMTRPFLMPSEPPIPDHWMSDAKTDTCMACHRVRFSMFARRHHCRRCGRIVCADCSRQRAYVRGESEARVCDDCYAQMVVIGEHSSQASSQAGSLPKSESRSDLRSMSKNDSRSDLRSLVASNAQRKIKEPPLPQNTPGMPWLLTTDDEVQNTKIRSNFVFESAPNLALCLSVLSLCSNSSKAAQLMLQIVSYLSK